jgi:hypothetical protein
MHLQDLWSRFPRCLRTRWPFKRYFWQQAEIDEAHARAKQTAKDLGWD